MRRWITLLLLVFLPLQLSWAAVGNYCQHETDARAARHFGHHQHVHADDAGQAVAGKSMVDSDCHACHASVPPLRAQSLALTPILSLSSLTADVSPAPSSAPTRTPDRPQWPRFA
ncbi:hypothetical protein OU995_18235 [Roseateles sp. SL47]|jgi:hypothetical protein|uniref:cation efflux protein, CzcI family n=1 Tax=Roseateles sp. SL47 TaxID=2995138 RepID=UPI00226D712F|nr:cation efflux protein, CzcI family [Roseateles sp. SL47]WAC71512.1 hypothetical protein OU995_18235 [Roseateles sp. SL47]